MNPLTPADPPPLEVFEAEREAMRAAVIAHKAARRVALGDRVTVLFEDRETIRWQVLEMCRVEGIRDAAGMAQELAVYNELVPGPGELSATLFIEITEANRIRPELDRLIGLHERFAVSPEQIARFGAESTPVALRSDHGNYAACTLLGAATRRSLAVDLRGDPEPIFHFAAASKRGQAPKLLRTRGRVRAVELAAGRVVVEAVPPAPPFVELPDDLAAELLGLAREIAADWRSRGRDAQLAIDSAGPHARIEIRAR